MVQETDEQMVEGKYWDEVKGGLTAVWRETWKDYLWAVMKEVGMAFGLV